MHRLHWLCIGAVFGGQAVELAGRAIDPEYQAQRLGSRMLGAYLLDSDVRYLTTYTRNPAVLRMMRTVAHTIYPINDDKQLKKLVQQMPHAEQPERGVAYHLNRYGPEGLYGVSDPAERPYFTDGVPLKDMYRSLRDVGAALIVAARVMPHLVESMDGIREFTDNTYNGEQR